MYHLFFAMLCNFLDRWHGERCGGSEVCRASESEEHASEWHRRYLSGIILAFPLLCIN